MPYSIANYLKLLMMIIRNLSPEKLVFFTMYPREVQDNDNKINGQIFPKQALSCLKIKPLGHLNKKYTVFGQDSLTCRFLPLKKAGNFLF